MYVVFKKYRNNEKVSRWTIEICVYVVGQPTPHQHDDHHQRREEGCCETMLNESTACTTAFRGATKRRSNKREGAQNWQNIFVAHNAIIRHFCSGRSFACPRPRCSARKNSNEYVLNNM